MSAQLFSITNCDTLRRDGNRISYWIPLSVSLSLFFCSKPWFFSFAASEVVNPAGLQDVRLFYSPRHDTPETEYIRNASSTPPQNVSPDPLRHCRRSSLLGPFLDITNMFYQERKKEEAGQIHVIHTHSRRHGRASFLQFLFILLFALIFSFPLHPFPLYTPPCNCTNGVEWKNHHHVEDGACRWRRLREAEDKKKEAGQISTRLEAQ